MVPMKTELINLADRYYYWKTELTEKLNWLDKHQTIKKYHNLKNLHFKKKSPEVNKCIIFPLHDYLPQFCC